MRRQIIRRTQHLDAGIFSRLLFTKKKKSYKAVASQLWMMIVIMTNVLVDMNKWRERYGKKGRRDRETPFVPMVSYITFNRSIVSMKGKWIWLMDLQHVDLCLTHFSKRKHIIPCLIIKKFRIFLPDTH